MNVSAQFLQQVRDECYNTSLRCLEATDFIGEHQEIPIINFCKALRDFLKLTEDEYVVNAWYENPVAFFDIAIEYYNLWIKYRINVLGKLSPLEMELDKTFEMISADWQWINYDDNRI